MELAICNLREADLCSIGRMTYFGEEAFEMVRCDHCGALIPVEDSEGICPACGERAAA